MNRRMNWLLAACVATLVCGCDDTPTEPAKNNPPPAPPPIVVEGAPPNSPGNSSPTEESAAEVGFGEKGHYESQDYISVVVGSQFRAEERITLGRVTQAMKQYRAIHGNYPKTDEEFFEEIIKANSISLPDLPAGQKYGYDPELAAESNAEQSLTILKPK